MNLIKYPPAFMYQVHLRGWFRRRHFTTMADAIFYPGDGTIEFRHRGSIEAVVSIKSFRYLTQVWPDNVQS